MAWHSSTRRDRLPNDWQARRRQVLTRDLVQCTAHTQDTRCTARATDVDHIQRGDNHDLDNLAALCNHHHSIKSSAEGNAARAAKRARLLLPTEQHPERGHDEHCGHSFRDERGNPGAHHLGWSHYYPRGVTLDPINSNAEMYSCPG